MPFVPALAGLAACRDQEIVVTTMGAAREWPKLSSHPLDFHYLPSTMGQAPLVALGLALAQPGREVICLNGDGCMLMNLGALVTIRAAAAVNLTLVVMDNGLYEVTGGQQTVAAVAQTDFAGFARAAGWPSVLEFDTLDDWQVAAPKLTEAPGPRFVVLHVEPIGPAYQLPSLGPMSERIAKFRQALGVA